MQEIIEKFNSLPELISHEAANEFVAFLAQKKINTAEEVHVRSSACENYKEKWKIVLTQVNAVGRAQLNLAQRRADEFFRYCSQIVSCGRIIQSKIQAVDGSDLENPWASRSRSSTSATPTPGE